ncbi:hypothetical protein BD410DRAFT_184214 [Rickenella mellea]|uniref:F-box domain-containing protein n=1 Tax=Rickenella mellea TaxID=50990 RepID=A0A4Y7Q806_9AGAM|nr:hypothetical protein BD410DRAFT_184214 [Rickenella mellea]
MSLSANLPPELWYHVIYWATFTAIRQCDMEPKAFGQLCDQDNSLATRALALSTKRSLVLVCSQWNALATEFLHEDVLVRHGSKALADVLDGSTPSRINGLAKYVRRVCIPLVTPDPKEIFETDSSRIISMCPNLTAITCYSGPDDGRVEFDDWFDRPHLTNVIPTESLRRFEWENHNSVNTTYLPSFLWKLTNLRSLSLRGSMHFPPRIAPLNFPKLHTLRLRMKLHESSYPMTVFLRATIPALRHVILETPLPGTAVSERFWTKFGSTLQVVEFGRHVEFLNAPPEGLSMMLRCCTQLEEFNFPIFFLFFPNPSVGYGNAHVKHIGIHPARNHLFDDRDHQGNWRWDQLQSHWTSFGEIYPSLKHIILYGDWRKVFSDGRFPPLIRMVQSRGINVSREDGVPVT